MAHRPGPSTWTTWPSRRLIETKGAADRHSSPCSGSAASGSGTAWSNALQVSHSSHHHLFLYSGTEVCSEVQRWTDAALSALTDRSLERMCDLQADGAVAVLASARGRFLYNGSLCSPEDLMGSLLNDLEKLTRALPEGTIGIFWPLAQDVRDYLAAHEDLHEALAEVELHLRRRGPGLLLQALDAINWVTVRYGGLPAEKIFRAFEALFAKRTVHGPAGYFRARLKCASRCPSLPLQFSPLGRSQRKGSTRPAGPSGPQAPKNSRAKDRGAKGTRGTRRMRRTTRTRTRRARQSLLLLDPRSGRPRGTGHSTAGPHRSLRPLRDLRGAQRLQPPLLLVHEHAVRGPPQYPTGNSRPCSQRRQL